MIGENALMRALSEYGAILFGLAMGTIAHFGRLMLAGEVPTKLQIFGFLMQLGLIGLLASVTTRQLGIDSEDMRALATAILAISAQEVIQYLKRNGWQLYARSAARPATLEELAEMLGEERNRTQAAISERAVQERSSDEP